MRMLVIGLGLILSTVAACLFWGGQTDQPEAPPLTTETRNSAGPTPMIEVAQAPAAPAAIEPLSEPRTQARELAQRVRIAETLAHQAVRPDQLVDAQLVRASLYDAQGRHEEANAALLHAADVNASEAAATSAKNPASPQPTPEHAAALTVLSHAHRELVWKNFEGARRHLNLVVETYAETAPAVAQQALSDLQWIASQEQQAERPAEALALSLVAGKRDIGDSSCHQKSIVPATSMGGSEIFANAVAGTSYTITASGIWAQDPDPSFNTGPNGFTGFGPIGGGEFAGMLFGTFAVREPGSSTWIAVGAGGTVTATADGPLVGAFADIAFAYNDNNGAMFVTVSSSECPPPPPAETLPPTAVNEASPETFYLDERGIWLDASLSTDNDTEGEDPAIRWYNWNLKNRSNPAQRAIIVEGQEALQSIYPTAPGEYDLVLTVTDNDGETASTSRVIKAVQVFFDPGYLEIPVGQTMVTVATVVPASAEGEVLFSTPNPETISLEAGGGGAGSISIAATGLSEGSTSILGFLESEPDRQGYMSVNVVPADPMTLPPTAIAATTAPVIAAGGTVVLDGSASVDNDENGASIVEYQWTFDNLTTPEQDAITITTQDSILHHTLGLGGEYEVTLIVKDNEEEMSTPHSSDSHLLIIVVSIEMTPDPITLLSGESAIATVNIVPSSAVDLVRLTSSDQQVAVIDRERVSNSPESIVVTGISDGDALLVAEVNTGAGSETGREVPIIVNSGFSARLTPLSGEHYPFGKTSSHENVSGLDMVGPRGGEPPDPVVLTWILEIDPPRPTPPAVGSIGAYVELIVRSQDGTEIVVLPRSRVVTGAAIPATNPATRVRLLTGGGLLSTGTNVIEWTGRIAPAKVPAEGSSTILTIEPFQVRNNTDQLNPPEQSQIRIRVASALALASLDGVLDPLSGAHVIPQDQKVRFIASVDSQPGGGLSKSKSNNFIILQDNNQDGQNDAGFVPILVSGEVQPGDAEFKTEMIGSWDQRDSNKRIVAEGRYLVLARCEMATKPVMFAFQIRPLVLEVKRTTFAYLVRTGDDLVEDGDRANGVHYAVKSQKPLPRGTKISWSYEFPGEHFTAKEQPELIFDSPTQTRTGISNIVYWYADKNPDQDPCGPSRIAPYDVVCTVTYPDGGLEKLRSSLRVLVANHGGKTTHPIAISSRGAIAANALSSLAVHEEEEEEEEGEGEILSYRFNAYNGNGFRQGEPNVKIFVPRKSQFYEKIVIHEDVHVKQFKGLANPDLSAWWSPARAKDFVNQVLKDRIYVNNQDLRNTVAQDIIDEFERFVDLESRDFETRIQGNKILNAIIEKPAYDASDMVAPRMLAQGVCILGNAGGGDSSLVQPLPIPDLIKTDQ